MTYQTTPYKPWIFPDQAYEMNRAGLRYSEFPSQSHFNPDVGEESPWAAHERQVAMDRVYNTHQANLGMEGKLNTTARSQRYDRPASRSAVPNGVFVDSPPGIYTSGNAFRGGRIYTKEGQEWLAQRLQQRIQEYDALATGTPAGPPSRISLSPNTTTVDSILSQIFSAFSVGNLSSAVIGLLNDLPTQFIRLGAEMTGAQVTKYSQAVQRLIETVRPLAGRPVQGQVQGFVFETAEKKLRSVDQINKILKVTEAVLREIARTVNEPLSARQQVMSQLSSRILGEQIAQYNPRFAGEERARAAQFPEEPVLGTETGRPLLESEPTQEELEQQQLAEIERELQAGQEAYEGYEPPGEAYAPLEGEGRRRRGRPRKYRH